MKKLICVLLVLVLCLGLGASALADGGAELPDVADYLASYLADYDPTARVHTQWQDENSVAMSIENATDMDEVMEQTRFALDVMFWYFDFDSMTELEEKPDQTQWETTYSYPDGGVGTVASFISETECNAYFIVADAEDFVIVMVGFGDGVILKSSGTDTATGTDAADTSASGDNILPDAWAFFHEKITHYDKLVTNGRTTHFGLVAEDRQACYEYVDLLLSGRFGFTLTDSWEKSVGAGKSIYYVFDYPGTGEDMEITREIDDRDVSGDLIVQIDDWRDVSWCDLFVRFSDALTVVDTGDRCTDTDLTDWSADDPQHSTGPMGSGASDPDSGSSGGSGSSSSGSSVFDDDDDYSPFTHETKCYKCHGDGEVECSQCDGDGGKWVYDSVPNYSGHSDTTVRTWESCFKCHGSGEMTCPACGGSGKG